MNDMTIRDPESCKHNVLRVGFDQGLVSHVICARCGIDVDEQMRSGEVYDRMDENVFVRNPDSKEVPEHQCSPPRGWGVPGDILTCQTCKAEYQYIKPWGFYPGWQLTKPGTRPNTDPSLLSDEALTEMAESMIPTRKETDGPSMAD